MIEATGPYQLLDPLSPEDFAALEADIVERGILVAIEFDENGKVLDGHHRLAICDKHGITDYPRIVREGWTEEQKRTHSRRMNLARRQLTRQQKRKLIEDKLKETPTESNRKIAKLLGVAHKTVASARARLVSGGEIPHVSSVSGDDGKMYGLPSGSAPRDFNAPNEIAKVLQWLRHRAEAWPEEHRPELAKALRTFAGEVMAGDEREATATTGAHK